MTITTESAPKRALPKHIRLIMETTDLERAKCNSRTFCVIACNIYRQLDLPIGRVRVSQSGVSIAKDGYRHYYKLPDKAARLVRDFDKGQSVEPIRYTLDLATRKKIQQTDPRRAEQIKGARKLREAALRAVGERPKQYPKGRFGI